MRNSRSKTAQFLIAFFMGIFILALPFSYALFKFAVKKAELPVVTEKFYPQINDTLVLTAALKNKPDDAPMSFVLCSISPYQNAIKFAVLPPETLVEDAGSFYLAAEVWDNEGPKRGAQALQSAAGITNGKWIELDSQAIVKLGEVVGAIDFTLSEEISLEQGLMVLPKERQLIDGTKAALLINYNGYSGKETQRLDMIGELFYQTLVQRAELLNDTLLLKLFETAVNNGDSDLVIADFESRRRALNYMMTNDFDVEEIEITGEYSGEDNTFLLSSSSIEKLINAFKTDKAI